MHLRPRAKDVLLAAASASHIPDDLMYSTGRPARFISNARELYSYVGAVEYGMSYSELGRAIDMDHSSIIASKRRFQHKLKHLQVSQHLVEQVMYLVTGTRRAAQKEAFGGYLTYNKETEVWALI